MPNTWTPLELGAALIAAWNPDDGQGVIPSTTGVSLSGAWGSGRLLTPGASAPGLLNGFGPAGQACLRLDRALGQTMTFPALPTGDLHIFVVLDFQSTSGDQVLFGRQAEQGPFVRFVSNASGFATLSVRTQSMGGGVSIPLPYRKAPGRFEVVELRYAAAAGTIMVLQGDRASPPVGVGGGGLPCNQIGGGKGANFVDGYVGPILVCDTLLDDARSGLIQSFLAPWSSKTFYISPTGLDTARGDRPDRPWLTLGRVEQLGFRCRPGDSFVLEAGMQIRRTAKFTPPGNGTAERPCTLRGAPGPVRPILYGSRRYAGGWTADVDGAWFREDLVEPPKMVWVTRAGGIATPIIRRPTSTANSFSYVAPRLKVSLEPGEDINACEVEVAGATAFSFYEGSRSFWTFENLSIRHMPRDGLAPQSGQGLAARNIDLLYCANDGWGPGGGTGLLLEDFVIRGCGQAKTDNSAAGDGISHHGSATAEVRRGLIEGCLKAGIDDERGARVVYEDILVQDCNHNYRWLNQSSSGRLDGSQVLRRLVIRRGAGDHAHGAEVESGLAPANFSFLAEDCTVTSTDPGPRRGAAFNLAGSAAALTNCRAEGFAQGAVGLPGLLVSGLTET